MSKLTILTFAAIITVSYGVELSNYDLSRNRINGARNGQYPGGSGVYPGQYPGQYNDNYGGQYGGYKPGLEGPPGAHPGCPLCDSSVYSFCSHKQAHDSCCCENSGYLPFSCRKANCKFLYANSCEEYHLITNCCCVDLQKSAVIPGVVAAPIAPLVV